MHNSNRFIFPAAITAKVDEIMSASRMRFGHDAFRMEDPPAGAPADPPKGDNPPADPPQSDPPPADPPGSEDLGDAGKKALDAMKAERKAAKDEAAAAKAERDALQAKLDGKEAEHAAAQEKAATEAAALAKANDRILKSEVKAAAKGVLADPQDAYKFLDLDSFEVDDDGNVDESAITDALKTLIAAKPYLAAQGSKFGNVDGGARNEAAKSIDDQIAEAQKAGDIQRAIALKQQRAAELAKK
jgi:hypothetical protein